MPTSRSGSRHTLVLGGGIAGMAAALALAKRGRAVTLLEARDRLGGRILQAGKIPRAPSIQLGAEFIHGGNAQLTRVLKAARIRPLAIDQSMWLVHDGVLQPVGHYFEEIADISRLMPARKPISVAEFLRKDEKTPDFLKRRIRDYLESFNGGSASKLSAMAVRADVGGTEEDQMRPDVGYGPLIQWYERELAKSGVRVELKQHAKEIAWSPGSVSLRTQDSIHFGDTVVITLPLGVLKAKSVTFTPRLLAKEKTIRKMGWGEVARITLQFDKDFWRSALVPDALKSKGRAAFGFLNGRGVAFPVWWVPDPAKPVLIAWAGGPKSSPLNRVSSDRWEQQALHSLAKLWKAPVRKMREKLVRSWAHNWTQDPYSSGAYSFTAAGAERSAAHLAAPVAKTLFFAGEATAEDVGTVHGALASGLRAAAELYE